MALPVPLDASPEEVREALRPLRNRVSVAVMSLSNAFAAGAIVRVAHSFLVDEVLFVGTEPHYPKASMGMEKYERIRRLADTRELAAALAGRPLFAVEREHATRSLYDTAPFPDGVVFLFGSERYGLPPDALARADAVVGIPMYGVNQSFPVAVAAGMVLGEWGRRHYGAGVALGGGERGGLVGI
jgi:tRNA G18 (ribose-2'-O)-methylase SpoU